MFGRMDNAGTIARRWFEEVWNERKEQTVYEMMAPDAVGHVEGGEITGPGEFVNLFYRPLLAAFPDLRVTLDAVVASESNAAVRWTFEGTHRGEFLGIAGTARKVKVRGMSWIRIEDGKLMEGWDSWNMSAMTPALSHGTGVPTVMVM